MAGELSLRVSLSFDKSDAEVKRSIGMSIDVAGDAFIHAVQSIGTSEEELAQGADIGTPGIVFAINLDATNYVEIGSTTGVYGIKLLAGEGYPWRHNSSTIYAKANTSACLVEYIIIEL